MKCVKPYIAAPTTYPALTVLTAQGGHNLEIIKAFVSFRRNHTATLPVMEICEDLRNIVRQDGTR